MIEWTQGVCDGNLLGLLELLISYEKYTDSVHGYFD